MTKNNKNPLTDLNLRFLFLVWGAPYQGPRSQVMAGRLGIEVYFLDTSLPRGPLYVPLKYTIQAVRTLFLLLRQRPQVIFVQNPPLLAVFSAYLYSLLTGAGYVIDAHSEALLDTNWTAPPDRIKRFLAKRAITTIVTNEHLAEMVETLHGDALIIRDIPADFQITDQFPMEGPFNVALVNTFASDEPLDEVLEAAQDLPDVHFYVTGKLAPKNSRFVEKAPPNVHFTGFLPTNTYHSLLSTAQAVMCLTTRNHTMQRGACEALSLGKPIITSDWPILRRYFNKGTLHVDNSVEEIRRGVRQMKEELDSFETGIKYLQLDQQREWQDKLKILAARIEEKLLSRQP